MFPNTFSNANKTALQKRFIKMTWMWKLNFFAVLILTFALALSSHSPKDQAKIVGPTTKFEFTQPFYNASVAENSLASTLVIPTNKMGIWNPDSTRIIKFRIVSGNPFRLFRVEGRQVGNFCFLNIRVHSNERILNREFKDMYKVQVKATLYSSSMIENETNSLVDGFSELKSPLSEKSYNLKSVLPDDSIRSQEKSKSLVTPIPLTTTTLYKPLHSTILESSGNVLKGFHELRELPLKSLASSNIHEFKIAKESDQSTENSDSVLIFNKPDPIDGNEKANGESLFRGTRANNLRRKSEGKLNESKSNPLLLLQKKTVRRSSRDERKSNKPRDRNKSEEKRKNRKEKHLTSSAELKVISSTMSIPTTTAATLMTSQTPSVSRKKVTLVPLFETETIVNIEIKDEADNPPVLESLIYEIGVNEDAPVLSIVARISAADADIGRNQEIYYSVAEWNDYWSIDPITGILSPIHPLTGSSKERQQLRIRAKNRWNSGLASESTAQVNIHIRPVNRYVPQILINRLHKVEWRPYGVIYAIISARDQDEGENGIVDLKIREGDPNGVFRVTPTSSRNEFYIEMSPIVAKYLNFNGLKPLFFNLTLRASDRGEPSKSSEKGLEIKVVDETGSSISSSVAIFDKDLYEVEISEAAPPHSVVFRLKRPDSKVVLSISSGNEGEEFSLKKSGVLCTSRWLDAEMKSTYTLTIDSLDLRPGRINQVRRHRSVVKILIKVLDSNNNSPIFDSTGLSEVYVLENEPVGTKVVKVTARDRDQGENGYVTYNIANLKPLPFSIDHFSGEIRTTEVLDYEISRRHFKLQIRASDWGQPFRRETQTTIHVALSQLNDNRPLFTVNNCVAVIDRGIRFETEFGKLGAIDFDRNDVVAFRIVGGNEDGCFELDVVSGRFRVMCDLKDLRASKRYLNVTATDGEYYSDVMTVKIELRDTLRTNFNKSDTLRTGVKLYSTSQSVFECQDTGIQERFERVAALSEENNKLYENDEGENGFSILPSRFGENIHSPEFVDFPKGITVNESAEVGSVVFKLKGRDADKGYNGALIFLISNGDEDHGAWDIINIESSTSSGETEAHLIVAAPLDREEFATYNLNISVWDQGKPPKCLSKSLNIHVQDVNDNVPTFVKSTLKVKIGEGSQLVGETILQVKAYDEDEEGTPNSAIVYRLLTETPEFKIDGKSGEIKLMSDLDRERQDLYELLVLAEDNGTPRLSSIAFATIQIEDRNDNTPTFFGDITSKIRIVKIREDWPVGAVVTRVFAKDKDLGLAGLVQYSLVDGSKGDFVLDEISGVLRVRKGLDYETISIYNLTIKARDLGTPSLWSETFIVVEIFDVEEMEPALSFSDIVTVASIEEGSRAGTIITQVVLDSFPQTSYSGIQFSIQDNSKLLFNIDETGTIRTTSVLDFETQSSHWLSVFARSANNFNNFARIDVFVEVKDVNDCVPLTEKAMYVVEISENVKAGELVLRIQAFDCDDNGGLKFTIKGPTTFFEIHPDSGEIRTTSVPLDREKQAQHVFDVTVTDSGIPPLSSTGKVTITVSDINDNSASFFTLGAVHNIPEMGIDLQGDEPSHAENLVDVEQEGFLKWSNWQVLELSEQNPQTEGWRRIHRVVAFDPDAGVNGSLQYRLKYQINTGESVNENHVFSIHPINGEIYTTSVTLKSETMLKFIVEASDNGNPVPMKTENVLILRVRAVNRRVSNPPKILTSNHEVSLTTREKPGYTVETIEASDPDGDPLWYEIVAGDPNLNFIMYSDSENVILAQPLTHARKFLLNISVSDGFNYVFTELIVNVIENEHVSSLIWNQETYTAWITESTNNSLITTVHVNTALSSNWTDEYSRILYGFHNAQDLRSLKLFNIDILSGDITIANSGQIDRETLPQHIITVKARDPFNYYIFARLIIIITDSNDHRPIFPSNTYGTDGRTEVRIAETTAIGSTLTQVQAFDMDSGQNGQLSYAITFGNTGNTFGIDKETGRIFLNRVLSVPHGETTLEYQLTIKATDNGTPQQLSTTTSVTVIVTLPSDGQVLELKCGNFPTKKIQVSVEENSAPGTFVTILQVTNSESVSFEIERNRDNLFWIDPVTGVILVGKNKGLLDRELKSSYEITVKATNSRGISATCPVVVHLLDQNDNRPVFTSIYYEGQISEDASLGSLVMKTDNSQDPSVELNTRTPLVLHSRDVDSGVNALVSYSFIEDEMRVVFHIDPSTGALQIVTPLDYEKKSNYRFHVRAMDGGGLMSSNIAEVNVTVINVNNKPPLVQGEWMQLLIPIANGVFVHLMSASDADRDSLSYSINSGNEFNAFSIGAETGEVLVAEAKNIIVGTHALEIGVSDGKFKVFGTLTIQVKQLEPNPLFDFRHQNCKASVVENSTKVMSLLSLSVIGAYMNEHLRFSILNPTPFFEIIPTSGVIFTTGKKLDREDLAVHNLLVEVQGDGLSRIARCNVTVTVVDVNDNCPIFLNLPYIAVVSLESKPGDTVFQVKAFDADENENSIVKYELARSPFGDIYELNKQTGEVLLRRKPDKIGIHEIVIKAYDGGIPTCTTETSVILKIVAYDQPVFEQQWYEAWIHEDAEIQSTVIQVLANGKNKILYSIEAGNQLDHFGMDYQTGIISVATPLDFEALSSYRLTIRSTDLVSSSWSTAIANIRVKDSNDNYPKIEKNVYTIKIVEGDIPSEGIVAVLKAHDNDTGLNSLLNYELIHDNFRTPRENELNDIVKRADDMTLPDFTKWFMIRPNEGSIILKQALDYEQFQAFRFSVVVRDSGIPSLSSTSRVVIEVLDQNEHPPIFEKQFYSAKVSETLKQGDFISKVSAYDPDFTDTILYLIIGHYHHEVVFDIDEQSGILTLAQPAALLTELNFTLNISATDGVFTSYTRIFIEVDPENHFSPKFPSLIYEVGCPENSPNGYVVATISSIDPDRSIFGKIKYSLTDTNEVGLFAIDENNGEVRLKTTMNSSLDREDKGSHTLEVVAQDGGGWLGFTKLVVKVIDVNEYAPQFSVSEYRITVPGDRLRSKLSIFQIVATDADTEFAIRYSFVEIPSVNFTGRKDSNFFEINAETGEIRLKFTEDDLSKFEKEGAVFQLWARAMDEGGLHSHVPVSVVVLPVGEPTPEIQPQNATFFVKEDAAVGSIVTTFRVTNIEHPRFRVVSSNQDYFQVDQNGNLFVNARLDHEEEDQHMVVIWTESSNGMSVATSQVTIRVLDGLNNLAPSFNSAEYVINVAEDFPEGSLIFTVHASNPDKTGNIKERYALAPDDPAINFYHFAVNQEHGWINVINKLDYETNKDHTLRVIAIDTDKPYLMSTATVFINVLNVNDEAPSFFGVKTEVEVREDIAQDTAVIKVRASDKDHGNDNRNITPDYLSYYIMKGNERNQFKISDEGEIIVVRPLDCEKQQVYQLQLLVTDGRYFDKSNLTINIIDVNDNAPVCPIPEYEHELYESVPKGTYVTSIEAYDPDFSAESLLFSLSGTGAVDFIIEPDSGIISVHAPLDRELKASYHLTVHAQDKDGEYECTCSLKILILDENDNTPVFIGMFQSDNSRSYDTRFTSEAYRFAVKEDAPIRALVGKVNAIDADFGVNRKIRYELLLSMTNTEAVNGQFIMDDTSGAITLLRPLDREIVSEYNLSVKATDGGNVPFSAFATVIVTVQDVNDNPPIFAFKIYSTSISEMASPLTEVTRVLATSKDDGVNADITYDIVGGNGYNHFGIYRNTGVIFVNATLDYERVREYVLTIRARDGGQPPLAAQCSVNISILDINDNKPIFPQNTYSIEIPEDLPVSTSVMRVIAADLDSGPNAQLLYQLGSGDRMNSFKIDTGTGVISVASVLDREMIPYYTLEVWAIDHGVPALSASTTVEISLLDKNDNSPLFSTENYTAVVQEDRIMGFVVLSFEVSDADAPPNGSPFSWDLRDLDGSKGTPIPFTVSDFPCINSNSRGYHTETPVEFGSLRKGKNYDNLSLGDCDNRTHGTLNVAGKLNYQRKNVYRLQVRVFDNGDPPLFSDANITVKVVDKSQWPPVVSHLSVTAITLEEPYPAGAPLGRVYASDFDPYDTLVYSLLKTPSSTYFTIDHYNGTLKSLIPLREGTYELGVAVNDGRWSARGDVYIKIVALASILPDIQLEAMKTEDAHSSTGKIQNTKSRKDISSFAVLLTLRGHTPQSLLGRIYALINVIKEAMTVEPNGLTGYEVVILSVQSAKIYPVASTLPENARKKRDSEVPSIDILVAVRKLNDGSLVSPFELIKRLRFAIPQIEAVLGAKVIQLTSDICKDTSCDRGQCRTGATFEGTQSLISSETLSLITPNHSLETFCICSPGYGGVKCEKVINACAHSECSSGYVCVPDTSPKGYSCLCRKPSCLQGTCEDKCSQQTISFSGTSFFEYSVGPSLEKELSISLSIKTVYTSGTLLHTFGPFDYAILEIKQGLVQFSWDLGTGKEVLTVTSISVSDNRWHRILLQLSDSHAVLGVDERSTQKQKSQGPARSLHTGGIIFIGARLIGRFGSATDSLIVAHGFNGCMKDLRYGYVNDNIFNGKKNDIQIQEVKHYITPGLNNRMNTKLVVVGNGENDDGESTESNNNSAGASTMYALPLHTSHKNKVGLNLIWSRNISFTCERAAHAAEACKSQPCLNGGSCSEDRATNGYTCECLSRFHGLTCGIDRDPCSSAPCLNGGKCTPRNSASISFSPSLASGGDHQEPQFYCNCVNGTFGSRCERGRWCKNADESEVCNHRGECEDGPTGPICFCEKSYTGIGCQLDVNECERGDACATGSSCINLIGGFRCLCPANATGVRCNRIVTSPSFVSTDYQIVILVTIIFFGIIFLVITFVLIRRCYVNRQRNSQPNIIPLTSSQVKDKDNRISTGRDNRDQRMRNRDSKISNLEVRPVSTAGSDIFPSDIRSQVDAIKMYGSVGDDLEKPQFINNLMKEKKRCDPVAWETNRDDYPKIQNYMKGEISWGSKGSNPSSPISTSVDLGFYMDHGDIIQSANISPTRILPPPPDGPDSASSVSHDSNSDVDKIKSLTSSSVPQESYRIPLLNSAVTPPYLGATGKESPWRIRKPGSFIYSQDTSMEIPGEDFTRACRTRYQKKPKGNMGSRANSGEISDDGINENSQLLGTHGGVSTRVFPEVTVPILEFNHDHCEFKNSLGSSSLHSQFPQKRIEPSTHSSDNTFVEKNNPGKKNYSKTTHITQV